MGTLQRTSLRRRQSGTAGFTLVEVALAIGIVAFAFVTLLALLPAGNTAFRRSIDMVVCSQIAQRVISEAQQADFRTLIDIRDPVTGRTKTQASPDRENFTFRGPTRGQPAFRYFDDQGREVLLQKADNPTPEEKRRIIYQVNTRINTRPTLPADRKAKAGRFPPEQQMACVTVQIALNPSLLEIPLSKASADSEDPMRNLWVPTAKQAAVQIYTYSAIVGRND